MREEKLDKGWEVEWCANVPVDKESGDADLDRADMRFRDFPSRTKARRFAKRILYEGTSSNSRADSTTKT